MPECGHSKSYPLKFGAEHSGAELGQANLMRVVLESNVLFSALISPHSPSHHIFQAWREGRFELITCRLQIDEIRRASRYPKLQRILQSYRVGALLNYLQRTNIIDILPSRIQVEDPDDAFLLALAEAGQADILVTGDRRAGLLPLGHHEPTRIVTSAFFCHEILKIKK